MGDIKKRRKKYSTPTHPWQKSRIDEEIALKNEYGLTNKKEIWKVATQLKVFKDRAKYLVAKDTPQAELETAQLLAKVRNLGLLGQEASMDNILDLNIKDLLERRLQTILFRKGLARSVKQARQFITHNHVSIAGKKISVPSYLVSIQEEESINFSPSSALSDAEHPERAVDSKSAPKKKSADKDPAEDKKSGSKEESKESAKQDTKEKPKQETEEKKSDKSDTSDKESADAEPKKKEEPKKE